MLWSFSRLPRRSLAGRCRSIALCANLSDDRVSVKRGRVLSELLPQRLIRLLPWKKAAHRLGVFIQGPVRLFLFLLLGLADRQERVLPNGSLMIHAPSAKALAVERVMLKLRAMPSTLVFNRRTISAANPAIHGSLTNTDVRERIASVYAVTGGEAEFTWLGNDPKLRIKALGSYKGKIAVRGGDKAKDLVEVEIKVVREE